MQLPTLTVTRDDAKQEVARYRHARRTITLTREDEQMLKAYVAIAKGYTVIDLHRAISLAGTQTKTAPVTRWQQGKSHRIDRDVVLPRLAVFRADKRWAWTDGIGADGTVTFRDTLLRRSGGSKARAAVGELRFQAVAAFSRDDSRTTLSEWRDPAFRALLPTIPPHLRPTRKLHGLQVPVDLARFMVLWEAEWELDKTVPPGDPALLSHLGGTLYRVHATWDLTPVEQAVLAGREPTPAELGER